MLTRTTVSKSLQTCYKVANRDGTGSRESIYIYIYIYIYITVNCIVRFGLPGNVFINAWNILLKLARSARQLEVDNGGFYEYISWKSQAGNHVQGHI
jgi:hypothetical protein